MNSAGMAPTGYRVVGSDAALLAQRAIGRLASPAFAGLLAVASRIEGAPQDCSPKESSSENEPPHCSLGERASASGRQYRRGQPDEGGMGVYGIEADGGVSSTESPVSRPSTSSRPMISTAASSATSSPTAIHSTTSAIRAIPIRSIARGVLNDALETDGRPYR